VRILRAVTFDFWSTLVDGTLTPERTAERIARLHALIVGAGHAVTSEDLMSAFNFAIERVSSAASESLEDVGPPGRWAELAHVLGIPDGLVPFEVVEKAYEDMTLQPPPELMPHVREAIEAMQRGNYKIGVICNTGMTGGRTLRQVLAHHGLLECFDVTLFSNEFGWSKPHPSIFAHALAELGGVAPGQALHVGDMEGLDVEGARRAGMFAALYAPGASGDIATDADLIVRDWRDFGAQIANFGKPENNP